jgi:multidrug efflux pump subunit AcrA (membrane-fusion protein)
MEELNDGLKIYSEEVRDVLSDPPKTILKWGNTILLGFISVLFVLSWYIKYPYIVVAPVVITTNIPPEKILAKTSGKIEAILVNDKVIVRENTPLAIIQNSADYKEVLNLSKDINFLNSQDESILSLNFNKIINRYRLSNLGEIRQAFSLFEKDCIANNLNQELQPFQVQA